MSINCVTISGNLTRNAELRNTNGGLPVLAFCVAVEDRRQNKQSGEWESHPNYIDCTLFGARANALALALKKGAKVCVWGKLRWTSWDTEAGKRSKIEVIVNDIELMSRAQGQQAQAQQQQPQGQPQQQPQADWSQYPPTFN